MVKHLKNFQAEHSYLKEVILIASDVVYLI